jgi:hypothetical protein
MTEIPFLLLRTKWRMRPRLQTLDYSEGPLVNGDVELFPGHVVAYLPVTEGRARAVMARHPPSPTPLSWKTASRILLDDDPVARAEVTEPSVIVDPRLQLLVPAASPKSDRSVVALALAWGLLVASLGLALPLG